MSSFNHPVFYALLMLAAGLGIPIMGALNGGLGEKLQNPALATSILFLVGSVISLSYLFISSGIPKFSPLASIPLYFYFGAFFVIFYIFSITWAAPKFGISNAIAFALLGQVISMAIIDHYGLFGALKSSVSIQRLAGLALMVTGIFMAVRRS